MNQAKSVLYRIDAQDKFIFVNEEWENFARDNDAAFLLSNGILGKSIWDFITDETTEQIYRKILDQTRAGKLIQFRFRCDSPELRRVTEMNVSALEEGNVQFETRMISIEQRLPQLVLKSDFPRARDVLCICGWCKKIEVANEIWEEVERAVTTLNLFNQEELPQLTHGICDGCYIEMLEKLEEKRLAMKRPN